MQKIVISRPGGYDRLRLEHAPSAPLVPGHVRVRVRAVGVNYADCIVRMGLYSSAKRYVGWPITPGFEIAGEVSEVASDCARAKVGERVLGVTRFGGYQSEIVLPEAQIFGLPEGWSYSRAASFPTVHLTAWYALRELNRIRPGDLVLVHSGAGGVGLAALAIAKRLGACTIAVVGAPHKVAIAKAGGATFVIDKSSEPLWRRVEELAPQGVHVVLESNGVETLSQSLAHLRSTGRLVVYGLSTMLPRGGRRINWFSLALNYLRTPRFSPFHLIDQNKSISCFNLSYLFDEQARLNEAMTELLDWARAEELGAPAPVREFALREAAEAHRLLESGNSVGKLVLVPEHEGS